MNAAQEPHRPHFAVLGGSFNPVHQGHVELIQAALRAGMDHVFAIPAARSPFKGARELLPEALRLAMLRAALKGTRRVSVLDLELRRPPPSFTVDTLEALSAWLPRARFSLLLGADAFEGFAQWRLASRILRRAALLLFARQDQAPALSDDPRDWIARLPEPDRSSARPCPAGSLQDDSGRIIVRRLPALIAAVSATRIRQRGSLADVPPGARELLSTHLAVHPR
jgi:nicotinate-nucleotide adenylyltransferase